MQNPGQVQAGAGGIGVPKSSSRGRFLMVGLVCVALLAGTGVYVVAHAKSAASLRRQQASAAAAQFLRTWATGNLSALPAQTVGRSPAVDAAYAAVDRALGIGPKAGGTGAALPTATPHGVHPNGHRGRLHPSQRRW